MTTTHRHRAITDRRLTVGYDHCVAPRDCRAAAHGGVCHIDYCACGAARRTNSTGFGREERGRWQQSPAA